MTVLVGGKSEPHFFSKIDKGCGQVMMEISQMRHGLVQDL